MINNVSQIASPYSKTAAKVNDTSTLDATEWNNISAAVETAHLKINQMLSSDNNSVVTLENSEDVTINAGNHITINGYTSILLESEGDIVLGTSDTSSISFTVGSDTVDLADIIAVVNFFKADTSTGPFASAA